MEHPEREFTNKTQTLEKAQASYLNKLIPGWCQKWITWSGGKLQALQIGSGPKALLIHGGLGDAFQYATIMKRLAERYECVAIDRPGHGLSDPIDYDGVDLLQHAETVLNDIYENEGIEKAVILATSMGGLWAIDFALKHPSRVEKLVLVGSPAGITKDLPAMLRFGTLPVLRGLIRGVMRTPTAESVRGFWKQMLVARPEKLAADFIEVSVASQARNAPSWFTLIDASMTVRGLRNYLLIGERWKELAVPVTCLWGDKDVWAAPTIGQKIADLTPNFETVVIENAGHAPWFDDLDAVVAGIERALAAK
ncbi:MAG TPA: alpha/beta hydrolase [Polyangiaceae bacterium]|nr:alpha/beta hydrolase [Polyangiaceae bacterium]